MMQNISGLLYREEQVDEQVPRMKLLSLSVKGARVVCVSLYSSLGGHQFTLHVVIPKSYGCFPF